MLALSSTSKMDKAFAVSLTLFTKLGEDIVHVLFFKKSLRARLHLLRLSTFGAGLS